ncbi:hypothetical protein PMAYCL1PPCAC_16447, partial [Pristionchus mayeri]
KFGIFVYSFPLYLPAGICMSYQFDHILLGNCTTPSRFPYNSGLPLDDRKKGFIRCAMRGFILADLQGIKECKGHVCVIVRLNESKVYGCITYDDRFLDHRMALGTHRMPDGQFLFLCDKDMCNQQEEGEVFPGLPSMTNETTCTCLAPAASGPPDSHHAAAATSPNLHLILGISIPAVVCILFSAGIIAFRVAKGKWPLCA